MSISDTINNANDISDFQIKLSLILKQERDDPKSTKLPKELISICISFLTINKMDRMRLLSR